MAHLDHGTIVAALLALPFVLNAILCVRLSLGRVRA